MTLEPDGAPEHQPSGAIVLAPYDERWPEDFDREAAAIRAALLQVAAEIHHIGSTAIPGIVAKPVIDMLLVVHEVALVDEKAGAIEALGYEVMGEFGIPGRRYFRKATKDGRRTHQMHAFGAGAPDIARHLAFRDFLRSNPAVADEYADLKRKLSRQCGSDTRRYTDGKTAFIRGVEKLALA